MISQSLLIFLYAVLFSAIFVVLLRVFRRAPVQKEKKRKWWQVALCVLLFVIWVTSGLFVIFLQVFPDNEYARMLKPLHTTVFGIHLFFWTLLGMTANYLWVLFRAGNGWADIKITELVLPFFVSPIVFFVVWGFASSQKIAFIHVLVAFQNGFFWQVILAKAGPLITKSRSVEPTGNVTPPSPAQQNIGATHHKSSNTISQQANSNLGNNSEDTDQLGKPPKQP